MGMGSSLGIETCSSQCSMRSEIIIYELRFDDNLLACFLGAVKSMRAVVVDVASLMCETDWMRDGVFRRVKFDDPAVDWGTQWRKWSELLVVRR